MRRAAALSAAVVMIGALGSRSVAQVPGGGDSRKTFELVSTVRQTLPRMTSRLWLAVDTAGARPRMPASFTQFADGVRLQSTGDAARALALVSTPGLSETVLADYALYYTALAKMGLRDPTVARRLFATVRQRQPAGYLGQAAILREAEAAEALGDPLGAVAALDPLSRVKTSAPDDILLRLARAAEAAGDHLKSAQAYARLYFEYPLSDLSAVAEAAIREEDLEPLSTSTGRFRLEIGRAERLFGAKRYAAAREGFALVQPYATGKEHELVLMRMAACDHYLRRSGAARAALKPLIEGAPSAEALYFYLTATRGAGHHDEYFRLARRLVTEYPESSWAEQTLDDLATHYIVQDEDDAADQVFRELYQKFPSGKYAPRAAWKAGWMAFRQGRYRETAQFFESAAATFGRSDYRPAYLYWAAKAHDRLDERVIANERYRLVITDYRNSYYGRLAENLLDARGVAKSGDRMVPVRMEIAPEPESPVPPPTHELIGVLIGLELYDQALDELSYAQQVWGTSPVIDATLAFIYNKKGELRRAINAVKRAYPQYLASGGEELPPALLRVLFPVDYWDLIRKHAGAHGLDPYLMAALIAQESTFEAAVKSHANAVGLMQLLPSTGRSVARSLRLPHSSSMLTRPEHNIQLGMKHFADLVKQLGGVHLALASYNAGAHRVGRWLDERPGVDRDEFIDDIPFPETQGYVKKILGTAEDYRRLYGGVETTMQAPRAASTGAGSKVAARQTSKPSSAKKASGKKPAAKRATPRKKATTKPA